LISLFFLLPLGIALAARWWFAVRVLTADGSRHCHCDLGRWFPPESDTTVVHRAENAAGNFGRDLRLKALAEWKQNEPKAVVSREKSRRFGMAVPPLSAIVAILGVLAARIPFIVAIAIVLGSILLATVFDILTLPLELNAIMRYAAKVRGDKCFPDSDEEDAVIRCALAHAWDQAMPPVVRYFLK